MHIDMDEDAIRTHFQQCGRVTQVRLIRDFKGRSQPHRSFQPNLISIRSKGFAYIDFDSEESVDHALKHHKEIVGERQIRVNLGNRRLCMCVCVCLLFPFAFHRLAGQFLSSLFFFSLIQSY